MLKNRGNNDIVELMKIKKKISEIKNRMAKKLKGK